jgi:hypothetical protein
MASVKETIEAAKNAAKAKVHQLMQSNAEKIAELTDQFKDVQKQIAVRVESKAEMQRELNAGEVPEAAVSLAKKNVKNMNSNINEKLDEGEKILRKLEKLGAKDQAQAMRTEMNGMANNSNAKRAIGV